MSNSAAQDSTKISYPFRFKYNEIIENRLAQVPIFLGHHNLISGVHKFGTDIILETEIIVEPESTMPRGGWLSISAFSYSSSRLSQSTKIGRYCSIAQDCKVMGPEHPLDRISTHLVSFRPYWLNDIRRRRGAAPYPAPFHEEHLGPVVIGNDVWVGQGVMFRPGVRVGDGAVIAGGSVVVKDVPPYAIVGGVPAKVIRYRLSEQVREFAQKLQWWRYAPEAFAGLRLDQPMDFLLALEERISGGLQPYAPPQIDLAKFVSRLSA